MAKNQHVVPHRGKWAVKGAGNQRATKVTSTQQQALTVARKIARNQGSDVVIHGRDGAIRDKDSFGSDPFPPRDKPELAPSPFWERVGVRVLRLGR